MKKFSNNLYRALRLVDASDILGSDLLTKFDVESSCQEVALWYLILDYHLQWLDEARDDEMEAVKEKFRELYRMMPKIYRMLALDLVNSLQFGKSGYTVTVEDADTNSPEITFHKKSE